MAELLATLWAGTAGIVMNIAIGLGTGIVSGLAVARAARFGYIKHQLHQMIRNWEFIGEDVTERVDCRRMQDIALELAFLGHQSACEFVLAASAEIGRRQQSRPTPLPAHAWPTKILDLDAILQARFRKLGPNWTAILFNGKL